jgi:hypothetical protein
MNQKEYTLSIKINDKQKIIGLSVFDTKNNLKYTGEKIIKDYSSDLSFYLANFQSDPHLINIDEKTFNQFLKADFRDIKDMFLIDFYKKYNFEEFIL